jgi:hypothetical protein
VYLVHQFWDVREAIYVSSDGINFENDTIPADPNDYSGG